MSKYLVTGAAGFIGYHLSEKLLGRGDEVIGLDNLNDYYDPTLTCRDIAATLWLLKDYCGGTANAYSSNT